MPTYTSTPSSFPAGSIITDVKLANWELLLDAISEAWTPYTPALTNLSVGNGTMTAKYIQAGKLVVCTGKIVLGSTSTVTGTIGIGIPVTAADTIAVGSALLYDSSTVATRSGGECDLASTTSLEFFGGNGGGPASATLPFTWTTGDQLRWEILYEAA